MKLRDKFIVHNMGDEILLVSADDSMNRGFIRGNSTTAIIIEALSEDISEEEIVERLLGEFDAPREVIAADVHEVIVKLEQIGAVQHLSEDCCCGNSGSLEEQLKRNGRIMYRVNGDSMMPLLRNESDVAVIVTAPEGKRLEKYEVALYKRESGQLVLHRIVKVNADSYVTCGDNRYFNESGVTDGQILGVLECVLRNGERIEPSEPAYIRELEKRRRGRLIKGVIQELKRRARAKKRN